MAPIPLTGMERQESAAVPCCEIRSSRWNTQCQRPMLPDARLSCTAGHIYG